MFNKKSKSAFTLAEVLITLTIIGVIASMTIPTLMANNQKQTFVTGLKKAYSTLTNTLTMLPAMEGCSSDDYVCAGLFNEYAPTQFTKKQATDIAEVVSSQMKVIKFCAANDKGCGADKTNAYFSGNSEIHDYFVEYPSFVTADGFAYAVYYAMLGGGASNQGIGFIVDVNGDKQPNKVGRDTFFFLLTPKFYNDIPQGRILPAGSAQYAKYQANDKYVAHTGDWETGSHQCNSSTGLGLYCAGRVLAEDAMKY